MNGTPAASPPQTAPPAPAAATATHPWGLYLHVIVVSLIGGFGVLAWFVLFEWLNKLLWDGSFVTGHAWTFPTICLPFSLLVGLLVKYAKAPSSSERASLQSVTSACTPSGTRSPSSDTGLGNLKKACWSVA